MKRLGVLFICLAFILSTGIAYAAPVGNIAMPKVLKKGLIIKGEENRFGIVLEPEVDYIFDRHLKDQKDDTEYKFLGGKAGVVVGDRAFLYGICGFADAEWKLKVSSNEVKWETDSDLAWGAGGTLIIYAKEIVVREKGLFTIGVDGRFRRSELDVDTVVLDGKTYPLSGPYVTSTKFKCDEWQVAVELTYQADRFIPYAGIKYSDVSGETAATISGKKYDKDLGADDNVGIFAGCDILIADSMSVYVEGRFVDETALSAGATIRF